jgi:hypothetical protein
MSKRLPVYPEEEGQEKALEFLKAVAKVTSGVLSPVFPELIEFCFRRPVEKRRDEWFNQLEGAFNEIGEEVNGLSPAKLAENEEFITVLHRATDLALRTHQAEKRRLHRNAVVSAGSLTPPELDKQTYFLKLVDELTINQVLVLNLYRNPLEWFNRHNYKPQDYSAASRIEVLNQAYPQFFENQDMKELVLGELNRQGLLSGLTGMVSGPTVYHPMTSKLGCEFLDYVKADDIEPK